MIKINLLGDETAVDNTGRYVVMAYVGSIAAAVAIFMFLLNATTNSIVDLTEQSSQLSQELTRWQKITKEVSELEKKRDEYNAKLVVIATLKKNKSGPVRVLDDLNTSLPDRSWLKEVQESSGVLKVVGRALDDQTIATFMRDLDRSDYFDKVDIVESKRLEQDGAKIREFTVTSNISYSGIIEPVKLEGSEPGKAVPAVSPEKKALNLATGQK